MSPPMPAPSRWIVVAHIVRTQGRKGELLADLLTDFPDRFSEDPAVYLAPEGFQGPPEDATLHRVTRFWFPLGRSAGRVVLTLAGVDSIESAEPLLGQDVLIPHEARTALEDGAAYIHDLIGCRLFDQGTLAGWVEDVQFTTQTTRGRSAEDAAPLLLVRSPSGTEILIPYVKAFIVSADLCAKLLHMHLPDGLLRLND